MKGGCFVCVFTVNSLRINSNSHALKLRVDLGRVISNFAAQIGRIALNVGGVARRDRYAVFVYLFFSFLYFIYLFIYFYLVL